MPVRLADNDLLQQAREWRQQEGMKVARDRLLVSLEHADADGGSFEKRLLRTNADKHFVYADSMATLSLAQRQRTGIFFVNGFHTSTGLSNKVAVNVVAALCRQGWHARLLEMVPHETVKQDARHVQTVLERELPLVDRAVVIGFSKGGLDLMEWFALEAGKLPLRQREKLRMMLSFSGVLRGSIVADWLYRGGLPFAQTVRCYVRMTDSQGRNVMEDVRSVSHDPWLQDAKPRLLHVDPSLRMVSLVAVPDGATGYPQVHRGFHLLSRLVATQWSWVGPLDGMTESASQVLPRGTGVEQHIVRVLGSHALLDGRYVNGAQVSAKFHVRDEQVHGGEEMLDDLLRSLPRAWVMPHG